MAEKVRNLGKETARSSIPESPEQDDPEEAYTRTHYDGSAKRLKKTKKTKKQKKYPKPVPFLCTRKLLFAYQQIFSRKFAGQKGVA